MAAVLSIVRSEQARAIEFVSGLRYAFHLDRTRCKLDSIRGRG